MLELVLPRTHLPRCRWRDGKGQSVEMLLDRFLEALPRPAEAQKRARVEAERSEREAAERRRLKLEAERKKAEDAARLKQLLDAVARWRLAQDIREYVEERRREGAALDAPRFALALEHAARLDRFTRSSAPQPGSA